MDTILGWYQYGLEWLKQPIVIQQDAVMPITFALCVFFVLSMYVLRARSHRDVANKKRTERDIKMRALRKQFRVEDAITDGLEDAVHYGQMSRRDAEYWYREIGNKMNLRGLIRRPMRKLHPHRLQMLKGEIMHRLYMAVHRKPSPIPGPVPGEKVPTNVIKMEVVQTKRDKAASFFKRQVA